MAVARAVPVVEFGAFSLAFGAYLLAMNLSRALATDPLTIRYSARPATDWRAGAAAATGTALAIGLAGGVACVALGALLGGGVGAAVSVLGIGLPGLLLQDAWRYAFFAVGRGRDAFANDLVWTITLAAALATAFATGARTIETFIAAWAVGGAAGAVFGVLQTRILPDVTATRRWLAEHRDLAPRLAVEALVLSGAQQLTLLLIGVVAGVAAVATVRGGQVLMNALNVAAYGIFLAAVPEGVRMLRRGPAALLRLSLAISGTLVGMSLVWTAFLLALPTELGVGLLGDTWASARLVILPVGIAQAATGVQTGAVVGLRALAMARRSLPTRVASSSLYMGGGVLGGVANGAVGAAWGIATGVTVGSLIWWGQLTRGLRSVDPEPAERFQVPAARAVEDVET